VARRANGCIVSITDSDYKNLNNNDIKDMYLLIINHKVDDYVETGLSWSLSVFIRSTVIWERVHNFQLGVESYQQHVNLTVPRITFPGIKKYKVFSIVSEPVYGIIYKNIKKETRVMRHQEVHKFCDATLKTVLEGLKSYNNDVKYGYVTHNLSKEDVEYLQLFAEEIEERTLTFCLVCPNINHVNFFDIEYPEIPYNDERVDPNMNSDKKSQSDSSYSSMPGGNVNTADFPNNYGNDADSSEDIFVTHDEQLNKISEPKSFYEASKFTHWIEAMNNEMDALLRNDTWDIVDLPKDGKAIGKWIDYEETFSPIVKMVTVRYIVVSMSWPVFQLDYDKDVFLALLVYVDDIILTGNNVSEIDKYKVFLKSKFMIKDLGKLKYFLGIEVIDTHNGICLNQRKYVLDLLSDYGMLACKPAKTPLMSKLVIFNEASVNDPILDNITDYQKLMRKIIYLTNTRPDISYVVHCLSPFMHSPLKSHLKIAFKILRYLKSCPGLGIHIIKNSGMSLSDFSDVDSAKCVVTRKSVTGYCVFLNDSLVSWKSKKQNTLSKSSTKAEYRALALVTSEVV
ncbi:ribonuclease H-like domain-containing protein, partial [Tanacetum coccineum]